MIDKIKQKMNSDKGAIGSVETVMLIAVAVFAVLAINRFIIEPMSTTSEGIGLEIEAMDPRN